MMPSPADVAKFSVKLEAEFGLVFDPGRREQVAEALRARCAATGLGIDGYFDRLDKEAEEWQKVAALLTVPESYFFRHIDHLRALIEIALPERMAAHPHDRVLRIACIGCANGEEPYTLSMLLLEQANTLADWQFRIHASDINSEALLRAQRGMYTSWALRGTPPAYRARYFSTSGNRHRIAEEVKQPVQFEMGNILSFRRAEAAESVDIVFFRNVLIYFSPEAIRASISTVAHMLAPNGYLFLGPTETLRGVSDDFRLCHTHDTFYYQRKEGVGALVPFSPFHSNGTRHTGPLSVAEHKEDQLKPASYALPELPGTEWMDEIERSAQRVRGLDAARKKESAAGEARRRKSGQVRSAADELKHLISLFSGERYAEVLESAAKLPPEIANEADVQQLRALAHLNRREIREAEAIAHEAVARDSMNAGAHYILALCQEHDKDFASASKHDRIAIYLDPSFAMPHMHLALLARRRGDLYTARREFEQAVLLLARESASRLAMFGGGFSREALRNVCRRELQGLGAA